MKAPQSNRGVALVIVLGFLVLLSGLAIAFFSSVTTELKASRTYANSVSTRQLAESAVNIVEGQIREATAKSETIWASQPGLIRVYDTPIGNSQPKAVNFYKLYSARNMIVTPSQITGGFNPGAVPRPFTNDRDGDKGDVPSDWNKYPALFTDLNSPVLVASANNANQMSPAFPIVDPRAKEMVDGEPLVEGFDYDADVNLAVANGSSDDLRLPMPARWIYVLSDGTLTTPKREFSFAGTTSGVEWTASDTDAPTKTNPIVGRIAFWTDDDTSKININTAGGYGKKTNSGFDNGYKADSYAAAFWDTPRVYTNFDIGQTDPGNGELLRGVGAGGLAATQPFQKEFQRYPGHPATTSLGAVFARLLTSEQIYKLTPRLNGGGSVGGTVRTEKAAAVELKLKTERLYASLDELLYSQSEVGSGRRETNDEMLGTSDAVTPEKLEKMKFFLTPHSRAPDLNLYGRPRVTIWPVNQTQDEATGRNGYDRAIAFCSTFANKKFIFTRSVASSGALSSTNDIGQTVYSNNKELLKYLRDLTGKPVPGFGGSFRDKYGEENRDMILGQIFDYVRIANLRDTTTGMTAQQYAKAGVVAPSRSDVFNSGRKIGGFGRAATISEATLVFYCAGIEAPTARKQDKPTEVIGNGLYMGEVLKEDRGTADKITHRYMRAFLVLSTFNPMQGYAPIVSPTTDNERQYFEISGLDSLTANGSPLWNQGKKTSKINTVSGSTWGGRNFGGYEGFMHTLQNHHNDYAYDSEYTVKMEYTKETFSFSGGTIKIAIKFGPSNILQTITLRFPSASWPVPERWYRVNPGGFVTAAQDNFNTGARVESAQNVLDFRTPAPESAALPGRISWSLRDSNNPNKDSNSVYNGQYGAERWRQIVQPGDVMRSLVYGRFNSSVDASNGGDLRVLALSEEPSVDDFLPHPDYSDTKLRSATQLRAADGGLYWQSSPMPCWRLDEVIQRQDILAADEPLTAFGKHVPSASAVSVSRAMALPLSKKNRGGVNQVVRYDKRPGDFDTGLGVFPDGPYGGKQDEGNVIFKYFDAGKQEMIYPIPYAGNQQYEPPGDIFFSPNRQMPSAGLFGSLLARPRAEDPNASPGSEKAARHWETLAFSPNTPSFSLAPHPGNTKIPRDHLLLDLFTMPFVEPYLISEPLSTAGRVNLNYQIAPFGYIKRSTAFRAAIAPLRVSAIKPVLLNSYKTGANSKPLSDPNDNIRLAINRDETVKAIDSFFSHYETNPHKGFFKSASEICERFLYPNGPNGAPLARFTPPTFDPDLLSSYDLPGNTRGEANIATFWAGRTLTGDNLREKPYADLYPRVTTKSNTYTVHMRVQTVRQVGADGDFSKWREGKDVILGEYRGATTIERYIDPADPRLASKVDSTSAEYDEDNLSLEDIYRFRIIGTRRFDP